MVLEAKDGEDSEGVDHLNFQFPVQFALLLQPTLLVLPPLLHPLLSHEHNLLAHEVRLVLPKVLPQLQSIRGLGHQFLRHLEVIGVPNAHRLYQALDLDFLARLQGLVP